MPERLSTEDGGMQPIIEYRMLRVVEALGEQGKGPKAGHPDGPEVGLALLRSHLERIRSSLLQAGYTEERLAQVDLEMRDTTSDIWRIVEVNGKWHVSGTGWTFNDDQEPP